MNLTKPGTNTQVKHHSNYLINVT